MNDRAPDRRMEPVRLYSISEWADQLAVYAAALDKAASDGDAGLTFVRARQCRDIIRAIFDECLALKNEITDSPPLSARLLTIERAA